MKLVNFNTIYSINFFKINDRLNFRISTDILDESLPLAPGTEHILSTFTPIDRKPKVLSTATTTEISSPLPILMPENESRGFTEVSTKKISNVIYSSAASATTSTTVWIRVKLFVTLSGFQTVGSESQSSRKSESTLANHQVSQTSTKASALPEIAEIDTMK